MTTSPDIAKETFYNHEEQNSLILDPNHPGIHDEAYIQRRKFFFDTARYYRLNEKGLPAVEYLDEEHTIWRTISNKLIQAHENHACQFYLEGKKSLGFATCHIPQLTQVHENLMRQHNMGLVPAEGLIDVKNFFHYLSNRRMPCTQFLRHGRKPEYTPEPDAVHDVIGHIPPLMNKAYTDLVQLIGEGVQAADTQQLQAWQRIYWFTIEFGLIEEADKLKVYGAGLLSSYGEMAYCFSDAVQRRPFDLDEVIQSEYDSTIMQNKLYIIPSLEFLMAEVKRLIHRFSV